MKITIKTQNSKMAFDLCQAEVESLVWTAFQYAAGNQPYQEEPGSGLEVQPEEECEGYAQDEGYAENEPGGPGEEKRRAGAPEPAEDQEMPEDARISEEPGQGDGIAGFDGSLAGAMEQEPSEGPTQNPAQEEPAQMPSEPQAMREPGSWKYKGFLLIKCQHCGKLKGLCAKIPIDTYICGCGGKTPIQNLVNATAVCECGKKWSYRTNANDQMIEVNCIQCGSPIDLKWNARRGMYVTLRDRD